MSSIKISVLRHGWCAVFSVTDFFTISVKFERFAQSQSRFSFEPGLHIIYGESGVGKSSFIRQLTGLKPTASSNFKIDIENQPNSLQIIFQNPDQHIINPTLFEELAFNYECNGLPPQVIEDNIQVIKNNWDFLNDDKRHPVTLSGGEKEILNIETSLSNNPELLMMDDCLSFLNNDSKKKMVERFEKQVREKQSIIIWFTSDKGDLLYSQNRYELSLSSFNTIHEINTAKYQLNKRPVGKLSLVLETLELKAGSKTILKDYSSKSEGIRCLGIAGNNGCGKTTLARALVGLIEPDSGTINFSLRHKENPKIGYLDQFPERLLASGSLYDFCQKLILHQKMTKNNFHKFVKTLSDHQINWDKTSSILADDLPWTILRLTLIYILIHCDYDILILDEPTFGLGEQQKLNLHSVLENYMFQKHLVLISHDLEFIYGLSDTILSFDSMKIETIPKRLQRHEQRQS